MKATKRVVYYCDMDGVLADFNNEPNALERFKTEKGFFANLKPIMINVEAIANMIYNGYKVRILSTSPNEQADSDKKEWLKKYLPMIKDEHIIMARPSREKIEYIKKQLRHNAILFDDYGKNIREWEENGGLVGIKITPKVERLNQFENLKQFQLTYLK